MNAMRTGMTSTTCTATVFSAVPSSLVTVSRREQSPGWVGMKM